MKPSRLDRGRFGGHNPVMSTSIRKQREFRARENALLDVGRRLLIEQGYAGLTMDRVAEATEYSKWIVYQHFASKEDLVAALLIQSTEHRLELFAKARTFQGRSRERLLALGVADELFARRYPHAFRSEQIVHMADLGERASADRREAMDRQDDLIAGLTREIVEEAVAAGDLIIPAGQTPGHVVFNLLAMVVGVHGFMINRPRMLAGLVADDPLVALRSGCHVVADGLGWRPLGNEWDYEASYRRILREAFGEASS